MRRPRHTLMIAMVAMTALTACRETPPTVPKTATAEPSRDPRREGDSAAQRGDWSTAAARYGEALQAAPNDMLLRFALGSAYSHLDRQADAIEQFSWVVEHGDPSRAEVASARQWLRDVGALAPSREAAPRENPATAGEVAASAVDTGSVTGTTAWPGLDRRVSVRVRLVGQTDATRDARDRVTIALGRPFTLSKVRAGAYRLIGDSRGVTLWDLPITIEANKATTVALSPANSAVPAADFPPPQ